MIRWQQIARAALILWLAQPSSLAAQQPSGAPQGGLLELPGSLPVTPSAVSPPPASPAVPPLPLASPLPAASPEPQVTPPGLTPTMPGGPISAGPEPTPSPAPVMQPVAIAPPPVSGQNTFSSPSQTAPRPLIAPTVPPNPQAAQAVSDMLSKNTDVLFAPLHFGPDLSLMFKKSDMSILNEALAVYDKSHVQNTQDTGKDDLTSLLSSLKGQKGDGGTPVNTPPPLPNLYLGSIVYYTPGSWSVWINGRKLTQGRNRPGGEFYVSRLSDSEIELVWKPASLLDIPAEWQRLTQNGAHPLPRVTVDEKAGTITLIMHANQTFLPHSLAIREGLIKSVPVTVPAGTYPTITPQTYPSHP